MAHLLSVDRFATVATEGFGRKSSGTAGSMVFFRGGVFVGTSCANPTSPDDAPRILRYDVKRGTWSTVYESPLIDPQPRSHVRDRQFGAGHVGRRRSGETDGAVAKIPRDSGYRSMCVFQGKSDQSPALYVSTAARTGALLLRSTDGAAFEPVSEPGFGDPNVYSFGALVDFGGCLFAVPAGTVTNTALDRNLPPDPSLFVSNDPVKGKWLEGAKSGFGNASNLAISCLHPAFGRLYAGTANADLGCQVWRMEARNKPPFDWSPVIVDGGGAFNNNFAVWAMAEFKGALYVGVGIGGFGYDRVHDLGPASAELWRIHPNGSWDLIAGQTRFTANGLKVPLSLLGLGLGDFYNSAVRTLAVHNGVLYLGTTHWEPYRCLEVQSTDIVGGYQLWASTDGEHWTRVLDDGNGSPADLGVASLLSTDEGLFVGTNNQGRFLGSVGARHGAVFNFAQGFKILRGH